jgi:hypothetical protein
MDAIDNDDRAELSPVRVESTWKQVIDVYRGGILADWYVPLLILPTIFLLMPNSRESSVQIQIAFPSLSKRKKRTLICL